MAALAAPRARIDSTVKKNSGRKEATKPLLSSKLARNPVAPVCVPVPVVTNNGDKGGVNPAQDAGTGTLLQALVDACADGSIMLDTAGNFATPQRITLSDQLTIGTDNVTIYGPDPATQRVTIDSGSPSTTASDIVGAGDSSF
jgi:hypothetical protein